jgi:topoisomerase-4 subunit A
MEGDRCRNRRSAQGVRPGNAPGQAPYRNRRAADGEREPVTVLCSAKGWIRAAKGHNLALADVKYKDGDEPRFALQVETTDKLLVFATNGRFYTISVDKLPGGRGHGEPLRLMIDLDNEHDLVTIMPYRAGVKLLVASSDGRGFVVPADEVLAQTRNGKQVLVVSDDVLAKVCVPADGDTVATVGDNHKLLVFAVDEVPEMARGRGVILQRFHDGGLADVKVFARANGLSWKQGETRTRTEMDLSTWSGPRAGAGRIAPTGFPRSNKFG